MKKFFLIILFFLISSCSGGSDSGSKSNEKKLVNISGIVLLEDNCFFDFDPKGVSRGTNNGYDNAQYIISPSNTGGYVNSISDQTDWYLFNSDQKIDIKFTADAGINAYIGRTPYFMSQFSQIAKDSGRYYIKIKAEKGRGTYLLNIIESSRKILSEKSDFVPGEVIVKLKKNIFRKKGSDFKSGDIVLKKKYTDFSVYKVTGKNLLSYDRDSLKKKTIEIISRLNENEMVEYAEPNYIRKLFYNPDDYYYNNENYLWNLHLIDVPYGWNISRGNDVIVAVLDSGIIAHEDLPQSRLVDGYDFIDDDKNPEDEIFSFHGIHVAGIIGAEMDNYIGIAGVAPSCFIMPVRVAGYSGIESVDIAAGIRFAAGLANVSGEIPAKKADIINMSFGGFDFSYTEKDAVDEAFAQGVILVASSGNDGENIKNYPAAYDKVVAVSSVGESGSIESYSNYGDFITLSAPGGSEDIINSSVVSLYGPEKDDYSYMGGTSIAAPHVSGIFALMKSVKNDLDGQSIFNLIANNSLTIDKGEAGFDEYYGFGLINAKKALSSIGDYTPWGKLTVFLKDFENNIVSEDFCVKINSGKYSFSFKNIKEGKYFIMAGFDLNSDGDFEDTGEIFSVSDIFSVEKNIVIKDLFLSF
ncbi:MAG: hypothetical protein CSA18_00455 [Deltaproteobacteria bacterium]|nr:MAG: hypothetical protein CSA18_00455 [Deltaproteobacteria bacterium]